VPLTFRHKTPRPNPQLSFELSEDDVRLPKLFRQTVPQRWPGSGKTAVSELVAWSLDQARSIVSRPQRTAASSAMCCVIVMCWKTVTICCQCLWI